MKGKIYLIPTPLGEEGLNALPKYTVDTVHQLDTFIVERAKTARHFIKSTQPPYPLSNVTIFDLSESPIDFQSIKHILNTGKNIGVMSEAGCPGIADPGALIVAWAHQLGYEVVPLVGPSSILLAVMGSGLNGQSFAFNGYLSAKKPELIKDIKRYEDIVRRTKQTQIFIETPYRNRQFIETALAILQPTTVLCIAADLTLPTQFIITKTIAQWRQNPPPDLHKRPAIFLIS